MKIVHDFFSQHGGGENLVTSISEILNAEIITAFNKKKIKYIKQSIFKSILKQSTLFVFIYFFLFLN